MLILGFIKIKDLENSGLGMDCRLRSYLLMKKVRDSYYVYIKNSMYPNCIIYRVVDLDQIHSEFVAKGRVSLQFKRPEHMVKLLADDIEVLKLFLRLLKNIIRGKNVVIEDMQMPETVPAKKFVTKRLTCKSTEFVAVDCFDPKILNIRNLNKLVLENCDLPNLSEEIGHLPLSYISLSGSKLGAASRYERDTLWDWMIVDTISNTLTTLRMDSINLQIVPFEILYLKKLATLSMSNNKLMFLPQFIGELKELKTLIVANNMINYFPGSLMKTSFIRIDISNNLFDRPLNFNAPITLLDDNILFYKQLLNKPCNIREEKSIVKSLSHLTFFSIIDNYIKFKRRDIPRTLWHYFNVVGRCKYCNKCLLPHYSVVYHAFGFPSVMYLITSHTSLPLRCQILTCQFKCTY